MRARTLIKLAVFVVVACVMAAMEVGTLTGPHVGATRSYHAIFGGSDGVSGLRVGNPVRVSGVAVGKVTGIRLVDAQHAEVTFTANGDQTLTTSTWAVVRYANLLGQRFLALTQSGDPGPPLPAGATIPQSQTAPALSLTVLFNGFRPLFAALSPQQVNDISGEIIAVLQGETSNIDDLVAQTAQLTANLADRDATFTAVVDNLSTLLDTVAAHDNELAGLVTSLRALTAQLHSQGPAIIDSLTSVDNLTSAVGGLLSRLEDHNLPGDIAAAASVSGVLAKNTDTLSTLIDGFVQAFGDFARITQDGNWANIYPCAVTILTYGQVSISAADGLKALEDGLGSLGALLKKLGLSAASLAALEVPTPLRLPNGRVGHDTAQTAVCS